MDIASGGYKHIFFKGGVNACQYNLGNLHVFTCIYVPLKTAMLVWARGWGLNCYLGNASNAQFNPICFTWDFPSFPKMVDECFLNGLR